MIINVETGLLFERKIYFDIETNTLIIANYSHGNDKVSVFTPCVDWDITFRMSRPDFFTTIISKSQFFEYTKEFKEYFWNI